MSTGTIWRDLLIGYRKKHALTQSDAAVRLGVSQQTISRWESGKQEPDQSAQTMLRATLGVLALSSRDSWIQRVNLSAGRESLFEQGWRFIAVSAKVAEANAPIDTRLIGKSLDSIPFLSAAAAALKMSAIFSGGARLIRLRLDFDLGDRSVGRAFDFWPVLTCADEILVHAIGYPCEATKQIHGQTGVRVLAFQEFPAHGPDLPHRRSA